MANHEGPGRGRWPYAAAMLLASINGAIASESDAPFANVPWAQVKPPRPGLPQFIDPPSGQGKPNYFHSNIKIAIPAGGYPKGVRPQIGTPSSGYLFETPASIACIYRLLPGASGCNPNVVTAVPQGGSRAIAVVDAFDYPTAEADLNVYIAQFGLPGANFRVIYGTGNPANGCPAARTGVAPPAAGTSGWDQEASLDVQMAHAMAPNATLFLVEANSPATADLMNAAAVATACVQAAGGGQVSMSWGSDEFSTEASYDSIFTSSYVTYFAAAGDYTGVSYPAASPYDWSRRDHDQPRPDHRRVPGRSHMEQFL